MLPIQGTLRVQDRILTSGYMKTVALKVMDSSSWIMIAEALPEDILSKSEQEYGTKISTENNAC